MKRPPYLGRSLLYLLLVFPVIFQGLLLVAVLGAGVLDCILPDSGMSVSVSIAGALLVWLLGREGKKVVLRAYPKSDDGVRMAECPPPPGDFWLRYQPVLIASLWSLFVALAGLLFPAPEEGRCLRYFSSSLG